MTPRASLTSWLSRLSLSAAAVVCAAGASGCAKPVVAAAPEPPPLEVPTVPPRLVGPVVVEEEAPPPVAEAPETVATRPPAKPRQTRPATSEGSVARGDSPLPEGGRAEPVEPAASPGGAAPLLRTPDTANNTEAIRRVRETLSRAQVNLSKVNPRALARGARSSHDTATRFIDQAEGALKSGRLDYAKFLAEKAETLSTSLLKR